MDTAFSERDLKCDFPARESFREALLSRLLVMGEGDVRQTAEDGSGEQGAERPRLVKLSDFELDLVAAAQGEESHRNNPFEE